ncbi:MAG: arginine--tRNA ligase, partial [Acutalibacteraceae bacterium]
MTFKQQIAQAVAQTLDVPCEQVFSLLETPPNPELGDYALPCFAFAKVLRKAPQLIAKQIVESALPGCVEKAEVAGGYANFTLDKAAYARLVLDQVLSEGEHYGAQDLGHGRTVCIDYSSINIAKQFHIGHLSSTAIGHALYNLYNFMGYKSVGINHLGDWGTQFGKLLAAYELWGDEQAVKEKGVEEMT